MLPDNFFHPYTVLYVAGFILAAICTQLKHRRHMMFVKFWAEACNGTYMILMGGLSGGLASYIAGTGGLIQAATPDRHLKRTIKPRIVLVSILSILSIHFSYREPIDLLPVAAIIVCRFMELHSNTEYIRRTYYLAGFPWIAYLYIKGIDLMLLTVALMNILFLIGMIRNRPKRIPPNLDPL